MTKLHTLISELEQKLSTPAEGDAINLVINEELAVKTNIVAVDGKDIHVGLDKKAFAVLEAAGLIREL